MKEDKNSNFSEKAKETTKQYAARTGSALKSPVAKEVYKAVGFAVVGATIGALTGFKINLGK